MAKKEIGQWHRDAIYKTLIDPLPHQTKAEALERLKRESEEEKKKTRFFDGSPTMELIFQTQIDPLMRQTKKQEKAKK